MNQQHRRSDNGRGPVAKPGTGNHLDSAISGAGMARAGDDADERLVLSDHERMMIMRRASGGLVRVIIAQAAVGCMVVLVSWLVAGMAAGISALIGAAAYFVPNALFAMRLLLGFFGPAKSSPFTFFAGEAFKLGSAVVILALAAWYGSEWLVWPALLLGLVGVLKGYVLLLLFRRLP